LIIGIAQFIILGLFFDFVFSKAKLPGLVGLLFAGVLIGPYAFNMINSQTLSVSYDLRIIALIIILLRAGFELNKDNLKKIGFRAILISFIPCILEISSVTFLAPKILNVSIIEAAILGAVLAAVSPAVVVPLMIKFIQEKRGEKKAIPTLVMAGASCDDALAIVLATSFIAIYVGETINLAKSIGFIPLSIISGIIIGIIVGKILHKIFKMIKFITTQKVLIIIAISIFLFFLEKTYAKDFPFSGLIAIMSLGFILLEKDKKISMQISNQLGSIWLFAKILLFILVGAKVNIPVAFEAGGAGLLIIFIGLIGRSIGVHICLIKSNLTFFEKIFVNVSYLPKATVQAAIGGLPLSAMIATGKPVFVGELILAIAVLSILVTAPIGAVLIAKVGDKVLSKD
jgi:NhaP-type Na+/H+ or K+/H+ antiporter